MMTNTNKRNFIKYTISIFITTTIASAAKVFAAWPQNLFSEKNSDNAINSLVNNGDVKESEQITIKAPDIAENGGVVPVTVSTDLENVKKIAIFVENNPTPLTSSFDFNQHLTPFVSTRVKMAKTSNIIAVVTTGNGNFRASRNIKVTIGGCGG